MTGKSPLTSKTLWLNLIAVASMLGQGQLGFVIGPEYQAAALGVINLVLRAVTKKPLDWTAVKNSSGKGSSICLAVVAAVLLALLSLPLLSGCAGLNSVDDPMTELVVRATTARVLAEHPDWTDKTITITNGTIAAIDGELLTTLAELQASVFEQIDWDQLQPEEQALLQVLISRVSQRLAERLAASGVTEPGEYLLPVRQVLLWINQTARLRVTSIVHERPDLFAGVDLDAIIDQAAQGVDRALGL